MLALLLASALASLQAGRADKPAPVFVPDPPAEQPGVVEGETWTFDGGDYTVRVQRLDDAARLDYITDRTGIRLDPFAPRPDRPRSYPTFLVQLRNLGSGTLSLHPQNCWLVAGVVPDYPLDVPTIESSYAMLEQPMPPAFRNLDKVLLDGEKVVGTGQQVSGLLVYRPLKPRVKRFRVEVQVTTPSGGVNRFAASYRREKKKKG